MAGYIGNRAAFLSSTSGADIDGNVTIDGDLTVSGNTVTIDSAQAQEIRLGDNDKMTFGDATGGDLRIYHDGTNSYIDDAGTGGLNIRGSSYVNIQKYTGETMALFNADGAVQLRYDNATKFATTSTGIDVTGTVRATQINNSGASGTELAIINDRAAGIGYYADNDGHTFKTYDNGWLTRLVIQESGNVGIGITSPAQLLHVQAGATGNGTIRVGGGAGLEISHDNSANTVQRIDSLYRTTSANANLQLRTGILTVHTGTSSTERMRITTDGHLLVGKTNDGDTNAGVRIRGDGLVQATRNGADPLSVNRTTNDGDIAIFRKDGTAMGSIGSRASQHLYIGSEDTGLLYQGAVDAIEPWDPSSNAARDNAIDLGISANGFKDLHMGGNVHYRGTRTHKVFKYSYHKFSSTSNTTQSSTTTWHAANGSSLTFTPQRSDTKIRVMADFNLAFAWDNPSGTNHGYIEGRLKLVNGTGTLYSSPSRYWGRVDNFTGIMEMVANTTNEYHMSIANNNGSTITISIEYALVRTSGSGLSRGGVNTWGGTSIIWVEEYLD